MIVENEIDFGQEMRFRILLNVSGTTPIYDAMYFWGID